MIVYRLCKAAYAALDGEGARLYGGRWNTAGGAMVYTAANPSLAVLEVLVHLDLPPELIPDDMVMLSIDVPDDASLVHVEETPADGDACRALGDAFLKEGATLGLRVRSAVVPQEWNTLLNVRHPDMARVSLIETLPFRFDPRLLS